MPSIGLGGCYPASQPSEPNGSRASLEHYPSDISKPSSSPLLGDPAMQRTPAGGSQPREIQRNNRVECRISHKSEEASLVLATEKVGLYSVFVRVDPAGRSGGTAIFQTNSGIPPRETQILVLSDYHWCKPIVCWEASSLALLDPLTLSRKIKRRQSSIEGCLRLSMVPRPTNRMGCCWTPVTTITTSIHKSCRNSTGKGRQFSGKPAQPTNCI